MACSRTSRSSETLNRRRKNRRFSFVGVKFSTCSSSQTRGPADPKAPAHHAWIVRVGIKARARRTFVDCVVETPAVTEHAVLVCARGRHAILRRAEHHRAGAGVGLQHVVTARVFCDVVADVVVGLRGEYAAEHPSPLGLRRATSSLGRRSFSEGGFARKRFCHSSRVQPLSRSIAGAVAGGVLAVTGPIGKTVN